MIVCVCVKNGLWTSTLINADNSHIHTRTSIQLVVNFVVHSLSLDLNWTKRIDSVYCTCIVYFAQPVFGPFTFLIFVLFLSFALIQWFSHPEQSKCDRWPTDRHTVHSILFLNQHIFLKFATAVVVLVFMATFRLNVRNYTFCTPTKFQIVIPIRWRLPHFFN